MLDDRGQLNVISYELCVLNQLRERVRAREIWVEGKNTRPDPHGESFRLSRRAPRPSAPGVEA